MPRSAPRSSGPRSRTAWPRGGSRWWSPGKTDLGPLQWLAPALTEGPDCVEIVAPAGVIHVRDSKHFHGPRLPLASAAWATLR
ncbi:DUF397 domain-containing protein [Streptomyces venezuelae]|uniref:DUF397 domain-containing protein n=1 Tax=Streptomyces venezuelae TaxID=54571 RepID=UPI00123BFAD1|nr:DUF397 domain-containing protein [Streptomyces venezuelae]QES08840.1 DUF397 domain-containing protein [Streptomyces venezuelae]